MWEASGCLKLRGNWVWEVGGYWMQSHYSHAMGDFYGTGIEIWAGFWPVRQLLRLDFSCFHGQKFFLKNIVDGENIFGIE